MHGTLVKLFLRLAHLANVNAVEYYDNVLINGTTVCLNDIFSLKFENMK